jgi:hypothetical protein
MLRREASTKLIVKRDEASASPVSPRRGQAPLVILPGTWQDEILNEFLE